MKRWLTPFLLFLTGWLGAQPTEPFSIRPVTTYQLGVDGWWFRNTLTGNPVFQSSLNGKIRGGNWESGLILRFNDEQAFSIPVTDRVILLPDSTELADPEAVSNNPSVLRYSWPVSVVGHWQTGPFRFEGAAHWLIQEATEPEPVLKTASPGVYYLDWNSTTTTAHRIVAQAGISWSAESLTLTGGFSGLEMGGAGPIGSLDGISASLRPDFRIRYQWPDFYAEAGFMQNAWFSGVSATTGFPGMDAPVKSSIQVKKPANNYSITDFQLQSVVPVYSFLDVVVAGRLASYQSDRFSPDDLNALLTTQAHTTDPMTPNQSIGIGVRFKLDPTFRSNPIRLTSQKTYISSVYSAKRSYYAYNPAATLDLYNTSPDAEPVQISARTSKVPVSFQSGQLVLQPGEIRQIPVYLYLGETALPAGSVSDQLDIFLIRDGKEERLTSLPLEVHDQNAWDGDTWGLRFFLTPQSPDILRYSKSRFIEAGLAGAQVSDSIRYAGLKSFLTLLGKSMRYIPDPSTSFLTDRVQYPAETLEKAGGDCEDLVVLTASYLMSVGMDCAVVDLRPGTKPAVTLPTAGTNASGHVFLLVDTGLTPRSQGLTGLNDYQAIIRKNAFGEPTIWIPVEVTLLPDGFDSAFSSGVQQYYDHVIVTDGVGNGSVYIYDF